jgi:hypothetical protein
LEATVLVGELALSDNLLLCHSNVKGNLLIHMQVRAKGNVSVVMVAMMMMTMMQ